MGLIQFFADRVKPAKMRGKGILHPANTGWITGEIGAIRQYDVNIWLYRKGGAVVAFDTGYQDYPDARKQVLSLGIDPDEVQAVFLTHADFDHAGGLLSKEPLFPNAKLYLCEKEEAMLNGTENRFTLGPIKLKNPIAYTGIRRLLKPDEELRIGDIDITLIYVPGHTPGHACYLIDGDVLVTGDCMAFNENGGYCFFSLFNMNTKRNKRSINRMRRRFAGKPPLIFLSGHSGVYQGDAAFAHVDEVAKGTRAKPFDPKAPYDAFADEDD